MFRKRALVMNVPFSMKGVFRVGLTTAMGEVQWSAVGKC